MDAVVHALRGVILFLAVLARRVKQQQRVQIVREVPVAFLVAFDGLGPREPCRLRGLRHALGQLREAVVQDFLDGGALADDALIDHVVAVPGALAVHRENRHAVEVELDRVLEEVFVQQAVDSAATVLHAVVGHDAHGVAALVVGHVHAGHLAAFGDPFLAVLLADVVLRAHLDDGSLERIASVDGDGVRIEIDVLHLLHAVERGHLELHVRLGVGLRLGPEAEVAEPEGHGRLEHVECRAAVAAVLQEGGTGRCHFAVLVVPHVRVVGVLVHGGVYGVAQDVHRPARPVSCDELVVGLVPLLAGKERAVLLYAGDLLAPLFGASMLEIFKFV